MHQKEDDQFGANVQNTTNGWKNIDASAPIVIKFYVTNGANAPSGRER